MPVDSLFIEDYQVFYYSVSNDSREAAYINCFNSNGEQIGCMRFLFDNITLPDSTMIPGVGGIIYYHLSRFNDVIGLLEHAKRQYQSMYINFDTENNIFALCHNIHVPVGI